MVVPEMTGRWLRPRQEMPPRCSGPEMNAADEPHCRQHQGQPIEARFARMTPQ